MKRSRIMGLVVLVVFLLGSLCCLLQYSNKSTDIGQKQKLVVVSPHPVDFMKPLIHEFENQTGISVEVIECGTTKAVETIVSDGNVDVLWGGSILSVGPYEDAFYPYETPNKEYFKSEFKNVSQNYNCFTDVPSVLMVNTDILGDIRIDGYEDLLKPELKGKIAFADPGKSSSSFEQLFNMLYAMGRENPENGWGYVENFIKNLDGHLLGSSSEVYQGVANGKFVVGLTFEEAAVTMLKSDKHVKIIYMDEGVISTPDGLYINKNTKRIEQAEAFVDFMTSHDIQFFISKELGRRSVREDVETSPIVIPKEDINIITADKNEVITNKEEWINRFLRIFEEENHE